jgi:hypothetical protein
MVAGGRRIAGPNMLKSTQKTTDQFGMQTLTVMQPESLCVPASFDGQHSRGGSGTCLLHRETEQARH